MMVIIYKHKVGPVSMNAWLFVRSQEDVAEAMRKAGLVLVCAEVDPGHGLRFVAENQALANTKGIMRVLAFANKLQAMGWTVDKQNFINFHYGYKKAYVYDAQPLVPLNAVKPVSAIYRRDLQMGPSKSFMLPASPLLQ
jgi:hypothetical protein